MWSSSSGLSKLIDRKEVTKFSICPSSSQCWCALIQPTLAILSEGYSMAGLFALIRPNLCTRPVTYRFGFVWLPQPEGRILGEGGFNPNEAWRLDQPPQPAARVTREPLLSTEVGPSLAGVCHDAKGKVSLSARGHQDWPDKGVIRASDHAWRRVDC